MLVPPSVWRYGPVASSILAVGLAALALGGAACSSATSDAGSVGDSNVDVATAEASPTIVPPTVSATPVSVPTLTPTAVPVPSATPTPTPTPTPAPPVVRASVEGAGDLLGVYRIDENRPQLRADASDAAAFAEHVWRRFDVMVPRRTSTNVSVLGVWESIPGDAFVVRDVPETMWQLHIARSVTDDRLDNLLLHEFNHMIVLADAQMRPVASGQACATWANQEGCAATDSMLARFVERFWPDELIEQLHVGSSPADLTAIVAERPGEFVSLYAATSPVEDMAETWVQFVRTARPQPDGTIATEKVLSLWDEPELWRLRAAIRLRLSR